MTSLSAHAQLRKVSGKEQEVGGTEMISPKNWTAAINGPVGKWLLFLVLQLIVTLSGQQVRFIQRVNISIKLMKKSMELNPRQSLRIAEITFRV